jgi:hypothetical protein
LCYRLCVTNNSLLHGLASEAASRATKGRHSTKPRKSGDPERTYFNKVGHVAIFLTAYVKSGPLKKSEYPQFKEKPVNDDAGG